MYFCILDEANFVKSTPLGNFDENLLDRDIYRRFNVLHLGTIRFETSSELPERLRRPARLLLDGTSTLVSRDVAETPNAFALVFATVIAPQRSRRQRLWGRRRMDVQYHIFCYLAKLLTSVAARSRGRPSRLLQREARFQ